MSLERQMDADVAQGLASRASTPMRPAAERYAGGATTRLELLGGFALRHDDRSVELPPASQRVLAFLALQARPVQRLYVAGNLWFDASEERAGASLRTALWRMRRPGCELVAATSTHVALGRGVEVDLDSSRSRARRIVSGRGRAEPGDLAELSVAGDLLPDWYDDWVLLERERFRQLRLHALESLCGELAADGRFAESAEAGLAAIEVEPLRESAHRALIGAYLCEGNACDAIRQFRFFRDLLRRELDLDPSPSMMHLVRSLPIR